jgi:LacI family transcriptional regulator, galactose operon repressor
MLQTYQKRKVTIQDIANCVGVSRMTVHRALKGSGQVKEATADKIKKAFKMKDMPLETFLRGKNKIVIHSSNRIDKTPFELSADFYLAIANNLIKQFNRVHFDVLQIDCSTVSENKEETKYLKAASILVVCEPFSEEEYHTVKSLNPNLKILSVLGRNYLQEACYVRGNDFAGGMLAAKTILNHGHKHVAVLGSLGAYDRMMRYASFRSQIEINGGSAKLFDCAPELPFEQKLEKFEELLSCSPKITAVLVLCGHNAVIFRNHLIKKGLKTPDNIGIVTFDNLKLYEMLGMKFTKVYFDLDSVALVSSQVALGMINGTMQQKCQILVPVKIEEGGSIIDVKKMH